MPTPVPPAPGPSERPGPSEDPGPPRGPAHTDGSGPFDGQDPVVPDLVLAIYEQRLASWASTELSRQQVTQTSQTWLEQAAETCRGIASACEREGSLLQDRLIASGIKAKVTPHGDRQYFLIEFLVDVSDLQSAVGALLEAGYTTRVPDSQGGWELLKHTRSSLLLIRTDDVTTRVVLRWREEREGSRLSRLLRPNELDSDLVSLPAPLWPLYYLVRPLRILIRSATGRRAERDLGYYLGTPRSVLPSIFDLVGLTPGDTLVDVGCGDGRVVIEAARSTGCRGIGVERDPDLAALAVSNATRAGVADRVSFQAVDATKADLSGVTVVFLFLPVHALGHLIPTLLERLPAGGRIVAHEQMKFDCFPPPNQSVPVLTSDAITVVHIWEKDSGPNTP